MAQNKVQYQRACRCWSSSSGMGLVRQCEALVRAWRWPQGFACPHCAGGWNSEFRRQDRLYFQCSLCRYQCSLVRGTVFYFSKLHMQVMTDREQWRRLVGGVEIDDAYLGGEVQGGKAGRGSPNKISFVAAAQTTESGQPVLMCLSQRPFTKESIQTFAEKSLAAPATMVSDGLGCFTAVRCTGILHEPHVIGGGAASA